MPTSQGTLPALPIDALLPEILRSLQTTPNLVIEAAPGAGKTTRIPAALLPLVPGKILVLEPRRIAARMAARRVAEELGEPLGQTVGYQVRFEEVGSPQTRLWFLTEGVFTRRLLSDPDLHGVDAVLLDEFHERHLEGDFALALLRRLQTRRLQANLPPLRLLVMSATLDAAPVAAWLDGCPVIRSEGRAYPLTLRYAPYTTLPLEAQVAAALEDLLANHHTGHVLIFLPGAAEIRKAMQASQPLAARYGALLLPLHGDLPPEEQDRAIAPNTHQKLLFATNVAESSVTIDGVTAVVDTGLARHAAQSPWTGLPTLNVERISQASAVQRAGRAGRTGPGLAIRLYPEADFAQRPAHDTPEILRSDLAGLCLNLRAMALPDARQLHWLDAPPDQALAQAQALLDRLAPNPADARDLARLPLPPRLARVLLEAQRRKVTYSAIQAAALLGSGARAGRADLLEALDQPLEPDADRHARQLRRLLRPSGPELPDDDALLLSLLAGFPDRVAQRRTGAQVLLSNGVTAELQGQPPPYDFMVVLDAQVRSDRPMPLARITARIEPDWLLDLFPADIREDVALEWNHVAERVEQVSSLRYGALTLDQSRGRSTDEQAVAHLLAEKANQLGLDRLVDPRELEESLARFAFAGLPAPDLPLMLQDLCLGLHSMAELRQQAGQLLPALERLGGHPLADRAPISLRLPGGRSTRVHYTPGQPPWIASRLQDFFGLRQTPRIGPDKTPVVVHLLAPNQRAVQTTTDLEGFWQRLYPQVRRELMRRYPRHAWPEDPTVPYVKPART